MTDLQLYRGDSLVINDKISVRQPTLGEIADLGEERYLSAVHALCGTPSDYMVVLDDLGLNFEQVTDFQMFVMLVRQLPQEDTAILLGDLCLSDFEYQVNVREGTDRLFCAKTGAVIDRAIYSQIVSYIRRTHWMKRNGDKGGNEHSRQYLIDRERRRLRYAKNKNFQSVLYPMVSTLCNTESFKYDMDTVWRMRIFAFYDSIRRIQKIQEAKALTAGIYSGNLNAKKIDKEALNWFGALK